MTKDLKNHPNYDADDYAYLSARGWTDDEILTRWDQEAAQGKGPCHWDSYWGKAKLARTLG